MPTGRPAAIRFAYRTSPLVLVPFDDLGRATTSDPPPSVSDTVVMELDTEGRLLNFFAVPKQIEGPDLPSPASVDWSVPFALAGLRFEEFRETRSLWTPRVHSDERRAWEGAWPELPGHPIRIEAAAYRGRIVVFDQVAPWSRATREVPPQTGSVWWISLVGGLIVFSLPVVAGWMAWRNVRAGRGDMRGALKLAVFATLLTLGTWVVGPAHVGDLQVRTAPGTRVARLRAARGSPGARRRRAGARLPANP